MKFQKKHFILISALILILIGVFVTFNYGNHIHIGNLAFPYFASGHYAAGIFAAGTFSIGIFSAGIFSIGVFSIGIFNIGLFGLGLFILAYKKKYPKAEFFKMNSASKSDH